MPGKQVGGRAVSCADCYFRQELLCALESNRVCPTFRATVGRRPARPLQAPLTPIPAMMAAASADMPAPQVAVAPERVSQIAHTPYTPDVRQDQPDTGTAAPFSDGSEESQFSVQDVRTGHGKSPDLRATRDVSACDAASPVRALEPVLVRATSKVQAPVRVAAARQDFGNELVIPIDDRDEAVYTQAGASGGSAGVMYRGVNPSRSSRIAQRIAARYPNSAAAQM